MKLCFLVIVPFYWGRGETIDEAKKKVREMGYHKGFPKIYTSIYAFPENSKPFLNEMGSIKWSGKQDDIIEIQIPKGSRLHKPQEVKSEKTKQ